MIELKSIDRYILRRAFKYYREHGFPFVNLTPHDLLIDFKSLLEARPKVTKRYGFKGDVFYSVGTGYAGFEFCKHFFQHQYKVKVYGSMGSPFDAYEKDKMLKKAIKMSYAYRNGISDSILRTYLSRVEWHQFATNFRPVSAKAIYERYLKNNSIAYDYCSGFGGRLSGFLSCKYAKTSKYIGVDPSTPTINGLQNMVDFLNATSNVELNQTVAEKFCPEKYHGKVDLAFSSPPYFCKEMYSDDEDQSFIKYPDYDSWRIFFLKKTIRNCFQLLKPGGHFIINIANVKIKGKEIPCGDDAEQYGKKMFGGLKEILALPMNTLFGVKDSPKKMEKIFVFQKGE